MLPLPTCGAKARRGSVMLPLTGFLFIVLGKGAGGNPVFKRGSLPEFPPEFDKLLYHALNIARGV